jgi:plastocyanin
MAGSGQNGPMTRLASGARCALIGIVAWATPALAANLSVFQKNLAFSTASLTLQPGDRLTIHNADNVTHNITVRGAGEDADTDDLGLQKPGVDVSYLFQARGTYTVVCSIHPRMRMIVNVK